MLTRTANVEAVARLDNLHRPQIVSGTTCLQLTNQYLDHIRLVDNLADSTIRSRRATLLAFCDHSGNPDISYVTLGHVDSFIAHRRGTCMASTVNIDKQALRSFFEYCQARRGLNLSFDYTMIKRSRERPPKVVAFDGNVISAVVAGCKQDIDALMIAMLYETGMRIGELASLQVDDIRDNEIMIRGKGERERVVMMTPVLASVLRNHLIERGITRGYVFQPLQHHANHQNIRYTKDTIRQRIKTQFARHGIKMHPHQLRHSFALNWLHSGGDVRVLQKLLGHDSLETTMRYLNITDSHLNEEYRRRMVKSVIQKQL